MFILINGNDYMVFQLLNNADMVETIIGQLGSWSCRGDRFTDLAGARKLWRQLLADGYHRDDEHAGVHDALREREELRREKHGWW